jgi:ankyrin repeat protein
LKISGPKDKNEKTPLMLAQSHRHYEIVKLLQNETKVLIEILFH